MVAADPSRTSSAKKCVKCGTDVTGKKRMKDSRGVYWCYDCGTRDQAEKSSGSGVGMMPCPACSKSFPTIQATKQGNSYVCPDCARKKMASVKPVMKSVKAPRPSRAKASMSSDEEASQRKKMLIAVGLFLSVALLITLQVMGVVKF